MAALVSHSREMTRPYLRGAWLAARAVQVAITLLAAGLFVAGLPPRYERLLALGAGRPLPLDAGSGDATRVHAALARLSLDPGLYAAANVALDVGVALVFCLVALAIARHKRDRRLSLLISLGLVVAGLTYPSPIDEFTRVHPDWEPVAIGVSRLGFAFALVLLYVFPDGRFVPRWMAPIAVFWIVLAILTTLFPEAPFNPIGWPILLQVLLVSLPWLVGTVAQVYRYRHVSSPTQRLQTRWALYGLIAAAVGLLFAGLLDLLIAPSPSLTVLEALVVLGTAPLKDLVVLLAPLSIGIAILRYHLWDVDVLINRTLVYVPLTAILAGLFAAGLGLTQRLFVVLTGDTSDAAVVLTTLVVVSAFEPIRMGLRATVDRRFKEPADRTRRLTAFGERARQVLAVIDVAQVTRGLLEEAVMAFDAECGAVHVSQDGAWQLLHRCGEWREGVARIEIPLESGGARVGVVSLGPRRDGADYSARDQQILRPIAGTVATLVRLAERPIGPAQAPEPSDADPRRRQPSNGSPGPAP